MAGLGLLAFILATSFGGSLQGTYCGDGPSGDPYCADVDASGRLVFRNADPFAAHNIETVQLDDSGRASTPLQKYKMTAQGVLTTDTEGNNPLLLRKKR